MRWLIAFWIALASLHAASPPFFQRGVNLTAEGPDGYSPAVAGAMITKLARYGVNAVALVPYGFERRGSPEVHYRSGWERADLIAEVAALAHRHAMKVMLKPQVWVPGGYPGDIAFLSEPARARWFAQYQSFLEYYARLAARIHADVFCIGVEFGKMTRYEGAWRKLIARTRQIYAGPLTYAANPGPEFETIRFWDALDYIGLNEYYPLPDDLSTRALVRKVEAVQRAYRKPVIFPEAGFASVKAPQRAPWDDASGALAPADQARCYEAILRAFYRRSWFEGVYWWKVGTDGYGGPQDRSHTPWGKPAMQVVRKWYKSGER
jgi:Glycoside Hydrolase Family 113